MKKIIIMVLIACSVFIVAFVLKEIEMQKEDKYQSNIATLSGNVTYFERIALPVSSVVELSLQDTSKMDVPATVIDTISIVTQGEQVPIPFTLTYNKQDIQEKHTYTISAKIIVDDKLRWINTESIPVLTYGAPLDNVDIRLYAVGSNENVALHGSTFKLIEFNDVEIVDEMPYTISFTDTTLTAKFCNNMTGEYTLNEQILKGMLVATKMICTTPKHIMDIENLFGTMISSGARLEQNGHVLTLSTEESKMTFQVFMD